MKKMEIVLLASVIIGQVIVFIFFDNLPKFLLVLIAVYVIVASFIIVFKGAKSFFYGGKRNK